MAYQIQPLSEFLVRPKLPEQLSRLPEIATNVLWAWDHQLRALFRRLDPVLWRESHNPVLMLSRLQSEVLERAAKDPRYLAVYKRACERFDAYMQASPAFDDSRLVAYFSMEYGLAECMPIYSGGLGVLSGDHMKSSSDENYPLVGGRAFVPERLLSAGLKSGWLAAGTHTDQRLLSAPSSTGAYQ